MAAHLFGYVGEVSDTQVTDDTTLKSGDIVGQQGIEKTYNALLMGEDGARRVVVNSVGREIRTLEEEEPAEGKRLQLTIDSDIQKAVEDAFDATADANLTNAGAAIVLDPQNGDVLAFASRPAYDPERLRQWHRPRDLGLAQYGSGSAAQRPRHPGAHAGPTFKMAVDLPRSKRESSRPIFM
jgi:penicillin-binding protein 2